MNWTERQQEVIDKKGKDILVSAAAGSGKTAVLVERIISRVLSKEDPVDIDRFLVLTFTKDAAREMKVRIRDRIESEIEQTADNKRLKREKTLTNYAMIMTIDGFCSYVVRNNFNDINVDPNFIILDENEAEIMKKEALDEVLEKNYEEKTEKFSDLVKAYKKKNSDSWIRDFVMNIYSKAISQPRPEKWLDEIISSYAAETEEDLMALPWIKETEAYVKKILLSIIETLDKGIEEIQNDFSIDEASKVIDDFEDLRSCFLPMLNDECFDFFSDIKNYSIKKAKSIKDPDLKACYQGIRNSVKESLGNMSCLPGREDLPKLFFELKESRAYFSEIIRLVKEFMAEYQKKKDEKNGLDFSDLEHFALKILCDENDEPTETARIFQDHFVEVMVDEYQDSNEIQELILKSVSKESRGGHNYFCVGDVKQSIYRFRSADPYIFSRKFKDFAEENKDHVRIDLNNNFRSRKNVIDTVNVIFRAIMDESMGNVGYGKEAELYKTGDFIAEDDPSFATEIYEIDPDPDLEDKNESEFIFISKKIRELIDNKFQVSCRDKDNKPALRDIRLSDIAILRRGVSDKYGKMTKLKKILASFGIDSVLAKEEGYFNSMEIENILSFLEILDNPLKDIDMTAVLLSRFAGLTTDELLRVRNLYPDSSIYYAIRNFRDDRSKGKIEEDLKETYDKINDFLGFYSSLRNSPDTELDDLLRIIIRKNDYLTYISSLPGGEQRRANVLKLIDTAASLQDKSGGFHAFSSYIRNLKKYDQEIGMAKLMGDDDNVVRIMTIHKSKGLEFPVVFLCGAGDRFKSGTNGDDTIIDAHYGAAFNLISRNERRERRLDETFYYSCLKALVKRDDLAEEERLLYVALTRAKDKLIVTGLKPAKKNDPAEGRFVFNDVMPLYIKNKVNNYLTWVVSPLITSDLKDSFHEISFKASPDQPLEDIEDTALDLFKEMEEKSFDADIKSIEERIAYNYSFGPESDYKSKYSVSEVKQADIQMNELLRDLDKDEVGELFIEKNNKKTDQAENDKDIVVAEDEFPVPEFIEKTEHVTATSYGTAMHKVLEGIDLLKDYNVRDDVISEINRMADMGFLSREMADKVNPDDIFKFLKSDMMVKLKAAASSGRLLREQNFVSSEELGRLFKNAEGVKERVLLQGTIDCLIVSDDSVIIIDYKTDRVEKEETLIKRYRLQLELYADAAAKAYSKEKKEMYIYSFALGRFIEVKS